MENNQMKINKIKEKKKWLIVAFGFGSWAVAVSGCKWAFKNKNKKELIWALDEMGF